MMKITKVNAAIAAIMVAVAVTLTGCGGILEALKGLQKAKECFTDTMKNVTAEAQEKGKTDKKIQAQFADFKKFCPKGKNTTCDTSDTNCDKDKCDCLRTHFVVEFHVIDKLGACCDPLKKVTSLEQMCNNITTSIEENVTAEEKVCKGKYGDLLKYSPTDSLISFDGDSIGFDVNEFGPVASVKIMMSSLGTAVPTGGFGGKETALFGAAVGGAVVMLIASVLRFRKSTRGKLGERLIEQTA